MAGIQTVPPASTGAVVMQSWLIAGMDVINADLPPRGVDVGARPSQVLARPDIAVCLADGVAVYSGNVAIGTISGPVLARLLAEASQAAEIALDTARGEVAALRRRRHALLANLGHELRTPTTAIAGYSELIALSLQNGQTVSAGRQNDVVWEAAQSLLGAIDSILDIARLEARETNLAESEFEVPSIARAVLRMLATLVDARGAHVALDFPSDLPPLFADPRMVRQVLVNLVSNAIKYAGVGAKITVMARIDRRERMIIEVRDDGPGMDADAIRAAMLPFRRAPGLANGDVPGTGLGLPLVKALVELHDGEFQLLSTAGKGTRALVKLPAGRVRQQRRGRQEAFAFQRAPGGVFG